MDVSNRQRALQIILLALVLALARSVWAHDVGLSRSDWILHGTALDATFVEADVSRVHVFADGKECVRTGTHFSCPSSSQLLVLRFDFIEEGHPHLVHVGGDVSLDAVADSAHKEVQVRGQTGLLSLVRMGIEHILTGFDHLAFLIGLVIVGGRGRDMLAAITAFTVAHSITLGMAAFGVVHGSPLFVEPLIALSVVWVGIENFRIPSIAGRWRLTLPFGLVHGFGFASALAALDLPRSRIPMALFGFNLGVEIGQLAVLALVLPLLFVLRKWKPFEKWGVRAISACIAALGAIWFVMRVVS